MTDDFDDIRKKYESKLKNNLDSDDPTAKSKSSSGSKDSQDPYQKTFVSSDYASFKKNSQPTHMSWYEQACNFSEKALKIDPDKTKLDELTEAIKICHLQITPAGATSFSVLAPISAALILILVSYVIPSLLFPGKESLFFVMFAVMFGLALVIPLQKLPYFMANSWRMKASNQMVLCVFYIVTYMRHTSNLERAIDFASEHLSPPLSLDMKSILWDVESEKYSTVKESLDAYLETWKKYNMEFIEAMHLIESSLYESSDGRRLDALDKSLRVILDETYEKMLHYAHNLKGPLSALHMLGIILPILGLVILPLAVSFMPEVKWFHLVVMYNVVLPILVLYLSKNILSTRPTGYGDSDISETNPELKKFKDVIIPFGKTEIRLSPFMISLSVFLILFFLGILPLLFHSLNPTTDLVFTSEKEFLVINEPTHPDASYYFIGYRHEIIGGEKTDNLVGPFGLGSLVLSFIFVLSFGVSFGLFFYLRSKNVIKIRDQSKALEQEFAAALFQLGNRIGDGIPAEIAFSKVSAVMEGTVSGKFFETVSNNITKLGMSVEQAIFDEKRGAIVYFPSNLIESSMKVLVESSKKGPNVASQALINVSEYIKQIHRVDERLRDLLADIISDMKSQIKFLTPAIAAIVVGITSMITQIIGSLSEKLGGLAESATAEGNSGGSQALLEMFGTGVPTYFFQIMVGIYVVQITYIMTVLINGVENGSDTLSERYQLGNNLMKTTITYVIIALAVSILFNVVAGSILTNINTQ